MDEVNSNPNDSETANENINFSNLIIKLLDYRFKQTQLVNEKLKEHFGSKLNIGNFIKKINSFSIYLPEFNSELFLLFPISSTNYCEIHPFIYNSDPNTRKKFYACTDYLDLVSKITILAEL